MNRRDLISLLALAPVLLPATRAFAGKPELFTEIVEGVALGGYDAVSYFSGAPVEGSEEFKTEWKGAEWRFASAVSRDAFIAAPEKYAPQYGGYCAYAVSKGATASGDPKAWTVNDNKLYLNYSPAVRDTWRQDIPGNVTKADGNWPKVLE